MNTFIISSFTSARKQTTDTIKLKYIGTFFILRTKDLHLSNSCYRCNVSILYGLDLLALLLDNKIQIKRGSATLGRTTYIIEPMHSRPSQDLTGQQKRKLCLTSKPSCSLGLGLLKHNKVFYFWVLLIYKLFVSKDHDTLTSIHNRWPKEQRAACRS